MTRSPPSLRWGGEGYGEGEGGGERGKERERRKERNEARRGRGMRGERAGE